MPSPTRIDGALPRPIGAPPNWDPDTHGHCGGLFVRIEEIEGLRYMRSAWEAEPLEALQLLAGAKWLLGISAPQHPVVQMGIGPVPESFGDVHTVRETIGQGGQAVVRVESLFCCADDQPAQRVFCERPVMGGDVSAATAEAMDENRALARARGWAK
jgi:hypothetical protein